MVKMGNVMGNILKRYISEVCAFLLLATVCTIPISADGPTTLVQVIVSDPIIGAGDPLNVSIYCVPGQPMKSFELSVYFNASLLHANEVIESTIFNGYTTFYNGGTIDNVNGSITAIYDLIVGIGNVSNPGFLVNISFSALSVTGTSQINLLNVGVTNETLYLPVTVVNSSVIIDASSPTYVDHSPHSGTTGDPFTFNISVSDNVGNASSIVAKVDWDHHMSGGNESMSFAGGSSFVKTVSLNASSISSMTYTIYLVDTQGNGVTTPLTSVTVSDNDPPTIVSDTSGGSGTTGDVFRWFLNLSDNVNAENELTVKVNWSHGSLSENASMGFVGSYWTYSHVLNHNLTAMVYSFYVRDAAGNSLYVSGGHSPVSVSDNDRPLIANCSATPSVQLANGMVNISAQITDNILVNRVFLRITYPNNSSENFSVTTNRTGSTYYCAKTYAAIGTYTFVFWANDSSNNANSSVAASFTITDGSSPVISNVSLRSSSPLDTNSLFGWVNISCNVSDDTLSMVKINISYPSGSYANISMSSKGVNSYYYNTTFSTGGNYSYMIWCNDTNNNVNVSTWYEYSMPPNWDMNNDGSVTVIDFTLISNHYSELGAAGWIREDVDNNGKIEVLDMVLVSDHYNEGWWD
jgi:hypothetical protein